MPNFADITGVGIGALAVVLFYKLAANHIKHNTEALEKLKDAINQLTMFLRERR